MPELNPFFHLQPVSEYKRLVKVVCGERQNAIIVERIGMKRDGEGELIPVMAEADNASQRYDPYYAISTTFAPEKFVGFFVKTQAYRFSFKSSPLLEYSIV